MKALLKFLWDCTVLFFGMSVLGCVVLMPAFLAWWTQNYWWLLGLLVTFALPIAVLVGLLYYPDIEIENTRV